MDRQKIEDKIRKLLNLSESSNANEAGVAFEKASELMGKHGVSKADVTDSPFKGVIGQESIDWISGDSINHVLIDSIAEAFGGKVFMKSVSEVYIVVGTPAVRATIKAMYEYSMQTVDRLTEAQPDLGFEFEQTYRHGVVGALQNTLKKITLQNQRDQVGGDQYGMILISNSMKVQDFIDKTFPPDEIGEERVNLAGEGKGYHLGKEDGQKVGFSKQTKGRNQKLLS